jgi:hypothetical protein
MKRTFLSLFLLALISVSYSPILSFAEIQKASEFSDTSKFESFAKQKGFMHTNTRRAMGYVFITKCKNSIQAKDDKGNILKDYPELSYVVTYKYPEIDYTIRVKKIYDDIINEMKKSGFHSSDDYNWSSDKYPYLVIKTSTSDDYDNPGFSTFTISLENQKE